MRVQGFKNHLIFYLLFLAVFSVSGSSYAWVAGARFKAEDGRVFKLNEELGNGGFGRVYKARDNEGNNVVIKIMARDYSNPPVELKSVTDAFSDVVLAYQHIQVGVGEHPNVLGVHEVFRVKKVGLVGSGFKTAVIMEEAATSVASVREKYGTIHEKFDATDRSQKIANVTQLLEDALGGVEALGSLGLVHQDIKPANILIGFDGTHKLADFDKLVQAGNEGKTGTPGYVPPEAEQKVRVNKFADYYGLAATIYYLLAGTSPMEKYLNNRVDQIAPEAVLEVSKIYDEFYSFTVDQIEGLLGHEVDEFDSQTMDRLEILVRFMKSSMRYLARDREKSIEKDFIPLLESKGDVARPLLDILTGDSCGDLLKAEAA